MSTRKFTLLLLPKLTLFYLPLVVIASVAVGMVIASRLDLSPASSAQTIAVPPMNSAPLTGPLTADTFRNIAKAQAPMVVNIKTEMKAKAQDLEDLFGGGGGAPDDFFRRFFGGPGGQGGQGPGPGRRQRAGAATRRRQKEPVARAAGTGFIISKDGFILTNNHVVEDAIKIEVYLYADDETSYSAKVIGRDALTDSALIQLIDKPSTPLPEARFGDSSQMAPGDWVMAIGNPFGLAHTVSVGVISATKRPFQVTDGRSNEMLQTDAAINPGNSGGPLLNLRGEVIGINTAIISNGRTEGNIGIGFAVPINTVRDLLPQLREGKVIRGRIGVTVSAVPREGYEDFGLKSRTGAIVGSVLSGGAAQKGGVEPGDVITEYNGRPVPNRDELVKMVIATKPGTSVPGEGAPEQAGADAARHRGPARSRCRAAEPALDANGQQPVTGNTTGRRVRPDARQRHAADRPAAAAAVGADRRARHRGRSGRPVGRPAARGRHRPVGEPQAGVERHRSGAGAAGGRLGSHRADPHLARRRSGVRDGEEGIATGSADPDPHP